MPENAPKSVLSLCSFQFYWHIFLGTEVCREECRLEQRNTAGIKAVLIPDYHPRGSLLARKEEVRCTIQKSVDAGAVSSAPHAADNPSCLPFDRQAILLDVRLPAKFEELRPKNSINVPLFIPIQKWWVSTSIDYKKQRSNRRKCDLVPFYLSSSTLLKLFFVFYS